MRTVAQQLDRLHTLLPVLACPVCGGVLAFSGADLVSTRCGARYSVVSGVPILLPPEMVAQGLGGQLGLDDNVSMHPYSDASNQIIDSTPEGWVLDLGAGGKHIEYPNVVQMDVFRFPMTDVVGSADCLPFASGSFRAVVSQAVFEHLQYPEAAASEVWRVLCPDGVAKIDTAFLQPEHAYPHHYFNATEAGLRHWFRDFDIEWSGVEPYQHPKWSLVWFLSVYFASLPDAEREILAPVGLGECLEILSRLSRGVTTAEDLPVVKALDALVPTGIRSLAAGVAVRAIKRAADGVVPRKSGNEANGGAALLAVERRLENLTRASQVDADYVRITRQVQLIAADRTRFLLHSLDQTNDHTREREVLMAAELTKVHQRLFEAEQRAEREVTLTLELSSTHDRLYQAEVRAEQYLTRSEQLTASRSWKLTKPLRLAVAALQRVRALSLRDSNKQDHLARKIEEVKNFCIQEVADATKPNPQGNSVDSLGALICSEEQHNGGSADEVEASLHQVRDGFGRVIVAKKEVSCAVVANGDLPNGVTFVVCPRHPVELLDQFFSLTRQTHGAWGLLILGSVEQPTHVKQLSFDLARLDSRVKVHVTEHTLYRSHIGHRRWALLTPDTVVAFEAVHEIITLGGRGRLPVVSEVDQYSADGSVMLRCHGFLPKEIAPSTWYDESWSEQNPASVEPWVAYSLSPGHTVTEDKSAFFRPLHVPQVLFRVQPFPVA